MSNQIISTRNIQKVYQIADISTTALEDISLDVNVGDFIAIMGPSGCGKSTLLNILGLLDKPTEGEYYFLDKDVSVYSEGMRSKLRKGNIGFIFQNCNLIDDLTVHENIELPLFYLKYKTNERNKKIKEILEYMEISDLESRYPYQLSGGEQQRVALSRAIVFKPKLILADEPTGNLDMNNTKKLMELLTQLNNQGQTIILVTHELECAKYCQKILNILYGRILE
jgi:putative ABC transport system ATP-binding protein